MMNLRDNKGVTLLVLTITIIVLLIITSITIGNLNNQLGKKNLNSLYSDIEAINTKIADYYLKNNSLPVFDENIYMNSSSQLKLLLKTNGGKGNLVNFNDDGSYYVINLSKLENLTLNYGREYSKWDNSSTYEYYQDLYIINEITHQVYYPKGVEYSGRTYFTTALPDEVEKIQNQEITNDGLELTIINANKNQISDSDKVVVEAEISLNIGSNFNKDTLKYSWNITQDNETESSKFTLNSSNSAKLTSKSIENNDEYYLYIYVLDINGEEHTLQEKIDFKPYVLEETIGGANAPDISGFNSDTTRYVTWDTQNSPYQIQENITINNPPPNGWSNYNAKEWANLKTTGGGNDCYWVWIPRYAYCITTGYHSNTAGEINIKFLKGTTNVPIDGSNITISNTSGSGKWNVHPAFWWDKDNDGIEEEGEQLTGIWVAKFEASSNSWEVFENPTVEQLKTNGGGQNTSLHVRVKPNVTSWREINVNGIFDVCQNLIEPYNSLCKTNNEKNEKLDPHMMKNVEWGACAYLSRSIYGINSEVWNNPYYMDTTYYSTITGLCGNASNGKDNATRDINNTLTYNAEKGGNASTTGNVYGIYDMSGGAWEYVAGYLSNITANTNYTTLASAALKYKDVYSGISSDRNINYNANTGKYGDAIYETSISGNSNTDSWDSSNAGFIEFNETVFMRGGHAFNTNSGVFAFGHSTSSRNLYMTFRPVVLTSQQ